MKINFVTRKEFLELVFEHTDELMDKISHPEAFVIKKYYKPEDILQWRRKMYERGLASDASWFPLKDECPDYHRLHDNYPGAWVKSKMHAFYNHGWYQHNSALFRFFEEMFDMKNKVGGFNKGDFISNKPSEGCVARVNFQHYPKGGGYMAEHVDPVGAHAKLQTLIQASQIGEDYETGGVFVREKAGAPKFFLDEQTSPGDLMVVSPYIPHGVDPVDPSAPYDWKSPSGRWVVIPLILTSDYVEGAQKPAALSTSDAEVANASA